MTRVCHSTFKTLQPSRRGSILADIRGFTMTELIVVAAMIGILSLIALTSFNLFKDRARSSRAMAEIRFIEKDINAFIIDKATLPPDLAAIDKADLLDPWGHKYEYQPFSSGNMRRMGVDLNEDYDLYSKGADGLSDLSLLEDISKDDLVRANEGVWVGYAREF